MEAVLLEASVGGCSEPWALTGLGAENLEGVLSGVRVPALNREEGFEGPVPSDPCSDLCAPA